MRLGSTKGLTVLEALISLCIIGILTGIVIVKYRQVALEAQKSALKTGLANIRTSIQLFKMLNGRNPKDLQEMVQKDVLLPARTGTDRYTGPIFLNQKYLMLQAVNSSGIIVDAFGNPYQFDSVKGEVRSTTKGYESW